MAESAAYARRTIKGGCAVAHIPGGLNTGVTGVVACDDLSTWVGATANGSTRLMLNRAGVGPAGSSPEEIEISTLSGNNITIAARGLQGTSQANHPTNSTIEVISSPRDLDEANQAVFQLLSKATTAGQVPYVTAAGVFAMLGVGTAGQVTVANDAATAPIKTNTPPLASWKQAVRVATTANGTDATAFANGQTVDGVVLATGDRILRKNQTTGSENGIFVVAASGAPTRATDFDTAAKCVASSIIPVQEGTTNGGTAWRLSNTGTVTPASTAMTFAQFGAGGIATSVLGAKGSLVVASAASTAAEFAIGSDFQLPRARAAATNGIEWATLAVSSTVATSQTTTSTTYTDLATSGPAITMTTGTAALVFITADKSLDTANAAYVGVAISGAGSVAAADTAAAGQSLGGFYMTSGTEMVHLTSFTAGSNTSTLKYRVATGTGTFANRRITQIAV